MTAKIVLKKCSKEGCDVQAQKSGCCDYIVKCNKCSNALLAPTSALCIADEWAREIGVSKQ